MSLKSSVVDSICCNLYYSVIYDKHLLHKIREYLAETKTFRINILTFKNSLLNTVYVVYSPATVVHIFSVHI